MPKAFILLILPVLAALAGCVAPISPPSAEASCAASMTHLDKAVGGKFAEPNRTALITDCVTEHSAILRKQPAECRLKALETPMIATGLPSMILAESRRTQIYNACLEAAEMGAPLSAHGEPPLPSFDVGTAAAVQQENMQNMQAQQQNWQAQQQNNFWQMQNWQA